MKHHVISTKSICFLLGLLLAACAQLPAAIKDLNWKDRWGDRGEQVLSRDYAMCQALVEQRRSLMSSCMATRGWYWDEAL